MQTTDGTRSNPAQLLRLLVLLAVLGCGCLLMVACDAGQPVHTRVTTGLGALLCLALPLRALYVGSRRYVRTGSWTLPPEERAAWRQRLGARSTPYRDHPAAFLLLAIAGLGPLTSSAVREFHRRDPIWNALLMAFWLTFVANQLRTWWKQTHQGGSASQEG